MKLINFKEVNVTFAKDQPEYLPLPAYRWNDSMGKITCCWKLSFFERLVILFTGNLWHSVLTFNKPLQPQLLEIKKPFFFQIPPAPPCPPPPSKR
jgi:hypothetical protein